MSTSNPSVFPPHVERARALLGNLSTPAGIRASLATTANYAAIFTRDATMAGIAGLLLRDGPLTSAFVVTLERLRELQGPQGQIASNYRVEEGGASRVSFGTMVPRVDATAWYLIGVGLAARAGAIDPSVFAASTEQAVELLDGLEYNGKHLIYLPPGSNWADEYVIDGYVLHEQVLRAWGLKLLATVYAKDAWASKADAITTVIASRYARPDGAYPLASVSPVAEWDVFDLASVAVLAASGLLPGVARRALEWIETSYVMQGQLPPAFHPVIGPGDVGWPALTRYHLFEFRNRPSEYHNGGVWPIWLGWLALGFKRLDMTNALNALTRLLAQRLDADSAYAFTEYWHGETGQALGVEQMAYSATGVVMTAHAATASSLSPLVP